MTFTLLDGGMGQELVKRAPHNPTSLWSADILQSYPNLVVEAHCDFIKAGADVITLSGYTVTPTRLARYNRQDDFEPLQRAAIEAAREAVQMFDTATLIAGCLPPLPNSYRPSERLPKQEAYEEYRRIAECQYKHVDLFLCETIASVEEAYISTDVAKQTGVPVWVSFTVDENDGRVLRSGESIIDGAKAALSRGADAILINCSPPESITQAIDELAVLDIPIGASANGFQTIEPLKENTTVAVLKARTELTPFLYTDFARTWLSKGTTIIGGCCEIGPHHISELNKLRN
jgi:homocysteine S-methyltransferase